MIRALTPILTMADVRAEVSVACFGYDHLSLAERRTAISLLIQGLPAAVIARILLVHRHKPEDGWIGT